jgi:hypothetical protein
MPLSVLGRPTVRRDYVQRRATSSRCPTTDYIERRIQEGKTRREATRCLKRYLARNLYRLLENPPLTT